jgi:hypothetical protein
MRQSLNLVQSAELFTNIENLFNNYNKNPAASIYDSQNSVYFGAKIKKQKLRLGDLTFEKEVLGDSTIIKVGIYSRKPGNLTLVEGTILTITNNPIRND